MMEMDHMGNRLIFENDKNKIYYHTSKDHCKISNTAKFGGEIV